jgi:IS30 family transposase
VDRVSIENRPTIVNERKRLCDYEIDLIVWPKNKGAILTIIDRMSRHCILKKLTGKTSLEV